MDKNLSVFDIADWFLAQDAMTHKKLQKLCYYAQAWYVALFDGTPLFPEAIQAWSTGPTIPKLYQKYKSFGSNPLAKITDHEIKFSAELEEFLLVLYNNYKHFTAEELKHLTQKEKPWAEARGELGPDEICTDEISLQTMRDFYFEKYQNNQSD